MDQATAEIDLTEQLVVDMLEDFDDELSEEQKERLDYYRDCLWQGLAHLTTRVPSECTEEELQRMHKGLKACLMFRNHIRSVVMEARNIPMPTPEELEEDYQAVLRATTTTLH